MPPKPTPEAPRARSGSVHECQRHTVRVVIRCSPDLAARARAAAAGQTLADVLEAGCEAHGLAPSPTP